MLREGPSGVVVIEETRANRGSSVMLLTRDMVIEETRLKLLSLLRGSSVMLLTLFKLLSLPSSSGLLLVRSTRRDDEVRRVDSRERFSSPAALLSSW